MLCVFRCEEEVAMSSTVPTEAVPARAARFSWPLVFGSLLGIGIAVLAIREFTGPVGKAEATTPEVRKPGFVPRTVEEKIAALLDDEKKKVPAPDLTGGSAWLNSAAPITMKDLKGKIVLLDFWTLCCINCIHNLPDLAKLEKKYANELVVIGVHSPKFDNEKDTKSIRKAVLRYQIEHPVVNDANHTIWDKYDVDAWPTLVLIDPEGNLLGYANGEGNYEVLDIVIGKVIEEHKKKKTLNEKPMRFDLAKFREGGDTPLYFPGKVVADPKSKRLFIADSTHHRIVVTDLDGNHLCTIGTGVPGLEDGAFDKARFDDPQGMAVKGDTLYVADRRNHVIREVDLKAKTVKTIAGTGEQEREPINRRIDRPVPAKSIGLNSPWDLLLDGNTLFIAMAGHHQIWSLDLAKAEMLPFAGSGRENIADGPPSVANFAQPSGLATDGKLLYVADSEVSALRTVPMAGGRVETLVGRGLFVFGDRDGPARIDDPLARELKEARLQHALGVTYADNKLYVADTYNSKIRLFDLKANTLDTFLGGEESDGWFTGPLFNEPAGINYAAGKLYVADTNAHRIRVIDVATKKVETLKLKGVNPPAMPKAP
jgi:DNA-binding beta-propeller fold protein YncE